MVRSDNSWLHISSLLCVDGFISKSSAWFILLLLSLLFIYLQPMSCLNVSEAFSCFETEGFQCRMRTYSCVYCPHRFLNNFSLSTYRTYSTNSTAVGFLKLWCTRSEGCASTLQGLCMIKHNAFNDYKQVVLWPFILACVRERGVPTLPGCWRGSLGRPPYECAAEASDYIQTNLKCMTDY